MKRLIEYILKRLRRDKMPQYEMPAEVAIDTAIIIVKHLRVLSPYLAAFSDTDDKEVKLELLSRVAKEVEDSPELKKDILKVLSNLTGVEIVTINKTTIDTASKTVGALDVKLLIESCVKLGIFNKKDIVNLTWIIQNWYKAPPRPTNT